MEEGATIAQLPPELVIRIFELLDVQSLFRVPLVCTHWLALSLEDSLWRSAENRVIQTISLLDSSNSYAIAKRILERVIFRLWRGGDPLLPCLRRLISNECFASHFADPLWTLKLLRLRRLHLLCFDLTTRAEVILMPRMSNDIVHDILAKRNQENGSAEFPICLEEEGPNDTEMKGRRWVFFRLSGRREASTQKLTLITRHDALQVRMSYLGPDVTVEVLFLEGHSARTVSSLLQQTEEDDMEGSSQDRKRRQPAEDHPRPKKRLKEKEEETLKDTHEDLGDNDFCWEVIFTVKMTQLRDGEEKEVYDSLVKVTRAIARETGCSLHNEDEYIVK